MIQTESRTANGLGNWESDWEMAEDKMLKLAPKQGCLGAANCSVLQTVHPVEGEQFNLKSL